MQYLATPSSPDTRAAMAAGRLACITTPAQGNRIPAGSLYACDNGKYGNGWPGTRAWHSWLTATIHRYGSDRCLFAVAPDTPFDAAATLAESTPWLPAIRNLGVPAAYAAQDGCEQPGLLPWTDIDVVFLAGSTPWKTGPTAYSIAQQAKARGMGVHMGRVNSLKRLRIAETFGCDSADGTFLAYGPDTNLPILLGWLDELHRRPSLFASDNNPTR